MRRGRGDDELVPLVLRSLMSVFRLDRTSRCEDCGGGRNAGGHVLEYVYWKSIKELVSKDEGRCCLLYGTS